MKQSKPYCAEVILSELMAAAGQPLQRDWLAARCVIEARDMQSQTAVRDALVPLANAGIIMCNMVRGELCWMFSPYGYALLSQRPPYDYRRCILDELAACGPCTIEDLIRACRTQVIGYTFEGFSEAFLRMIRHDCLIVDVTDPEDGFSTYDLPEHTE